MGHFYNNVLSHFEENHEVSKKNTFRYEKAGVTDKTLSKIPEDIKAIKLGLFLFSVIILFKVMILSKPICERSVQSAIGGRNCDQMICQSSTYICFPLIFLFHLFSSIINNS